MQDHQESPSRRQQIEQHLEAIRRLSEAETAQSETSRESGGTWPPQQFYLLWHVLVGMMLGFIGAAVGLTFNTIGASFTGEHPLQLIRVFLTFPMGAEALTATGGKVLTVGCMLYLITGGLYGIAFHLIMNGYFSGAPLKKRFVAGSLMGLGLWVVNFYLILSWLQPMLLGGNWIVQMVPFWVAALTHLVFAWTMLLIESWGQFDPGAYRQ